VSNDAAMWRSGRTGVLAPRHRQTITLGTLEESLWHASSPSPSPRAARARPQLPSTWARPWPLAGTGCLLIDFDPQGNLSLSLRVTPGKPSLYPVTREFIATWEPHLDRVIQPSTIPNVDVVPTDVWLNEADEELRGADRREYVLQKLLGPLPPPMTL
jgi:hypothetical protein